MLTNCPLGEKETHACWECLFNGHKESNVAYNPQGKKCTHPNYKETVRVKPRKIETAFCEECGKHVKFTVDWEGVVSPTREGIIKYKELYAICKECDNEIYVPAINDINVFRREKAYAEKIPEPIQIPIAAGELAQQIEEQLKMKPSEETERGKEILKEMFKDKER